MGRYNLLSLHAPLQISFPASTCSPILCPPHILLRQAHPNARNAESAGSVREAAPDYKAAKSVSPARVAANQLSSQHMLSHSLPAARAFFPHNPIMVIVRGYGGAAPMITHRP